jgi:hypothetical protein
VARGLNDAAAEQARLRGETREIADFAVTQMKGTVEESEMWSVFACGLLCGFGMLFLRYWLGIHL